MKTILTYNFRRFPQRRSSVHTLCLAIFLIFTGSPLYAEDPKPDSIRKSILALESARHAALQELQGTTIPAGEISDYKDFVVYLNTRIVNYCTALAEQGGAVTLEGLPCPEVPAMTGKRERTASDDRVFYTTRSSSSEARSPAEETAELEGAFLSSLGDFDDSLLKEEEKVAARVPSQRESGRSGSSGSNAQAGEPGDSNAADNGMSNDQSDSSATDQNLESQAESARDATDRSGAQGNRVEQSTYGTAGGRLPPPKDDDIVARQLREAAEKEPDPELRKKLWEEYWKYKGVNKKRGDY